MALIFLIALLSVFLTLTGVQVFFILRDLKKTLDKLNTILYSDEVKEKLNDFTKRVVKSQSNNRRLFKKSR